MRPLRMLEETVRRRLERSRRTLERENGEGRGGTVALAAHSTVTVRGDAPTGPAPEVLAARLRRDQASADLLPEDHGEAALRPQNPWLVGGGVFTALGAVVVGYAVWAAGTPPTLTLAHASGGDPARGQALYAAYGCASCHIDRPLSIRRGEVGPRLDRFANRPLIAGALPNTEANLIRYLVSPRQEVPRTAMPDLNVTPQDARDLAAYLYTLGEVPR